MANELKPCPFCNAQATVEKIGRDWWRLDVEHSDNCVLDSDHRLNAPQTDAGLEWLTAAWNIRINPAQQDAPTDAALHPNHIPDLRYILAVLERLSKSKPKDGELSAAVNGMRYVVSRTEDAARAQRADKEDGK